ncbi:mitochondrial translation initiation factor 3 [Arctopsyche grandis]|uniref:mitochondrial translation initiation factor 3 n=1 Tax=Arctopsyche grandis TaxID=121162 RepID=UPI00406D9648
MLRCVLLLSRGFAGGVGRTVKKPPEPPRPPRPPRITLISSDNSVSILDKAEAENIAKIKRFKLVKIEDYDAQTRRPVYKLMSPSEYLKEEMQKRSEKKADKNKSTIKGRKVLPIATKIGDNDLQTRINNLKRWLDKNYEVKVIINGDKENTEKSAKIFTKVTGECPPECNIQQKVVKGGDIKFVVCPQPRSETKASDDASQSGQHKNTSDESNKS